LIDQDTSILSYITSVNEFIVNAKKTKDFGGVLIHDDDSNSRACMVCMAYLIQFEMMTFDEAYGAVAANYITVHPHRSWIRQLTKLSEQNHGPCKPLKERKKAMRDNCWGTRWEPYADRFGEPAPTYDEHKILEQDFVGIPVPTPDNPMYMRIKAFHEVDPIEAAAAEAEKKAKEDAKAKEDKKKKKKK